MKGYPKPSFSFSKKHDLSRGEIGDPGVPSEAEDSSVWALNDPVVDSDRSRIPRRICREESEEIFQIWPFEETHAKS